MTSVAILGGGAGGCSAAVDLGLAGHRIRLWNRRPATVGALLDGQPLSYEGVLGSGEYLPELVSTRLSDVLDGAEVVVMCQPALAHADMLTELAKLGLDRPLILNPGHTCGALHARAVFAAHAQPRPPIAELSTLTYIARKPAAERVSVYAKAGRVHAAALPGGAAALDQAVRLFPAARPATDVLATSLANVNLVLHPPGTILGAAWIEATGGNYTFYVMGMTDGVIRVVEQLDHERLSVARAFGHDLPPLIDEMAAIGTVDPDARRAGAAPAIRGAAANSTIKAPDSLRHRYFREDFPFGLVPFIALAGIVDVPVPVARSLLLLGEVATGEAWGAHGLDLARLDLVGCGPDELRAIVRG
jgi:opine dehydrogenase